MVVPSVLLVVSMSGDAPVTVTVSDSEATFRLMFTVSSWPMLSGTLL